MMNGSGMEVNWIFQYLFIAIILGVLIMFANKGKRKNSSDALPENPLEILNQRYAKGEISRDEYKQTRKDLTNAQRN